MKRILLCCLFAFTAPTSWIYAGIKFQDVAVQHFAQLASGGGWKTTFVLTGLGASPAVHIDFFADDGSPLVLDLVIQTGAVISQSSRSSSIDLGLEPNQIVTIISQNDAIPVRTGWAELSGTNVSNYAAVPAQSVSGYEIFSFNTGVFESESLVTLQPESSNPFAIQFDNTNGNRTGIALINENSSPITFTMSATDELDELLFLNKKVTLPAYGHMSLYLDGLSPLTANHLGVVSIASSLSGLYIDGIGLRFNPTGGFTSIPVIRP